MNYLDAWKIVNDFINFFANHTCEKYFAYPSNLLPFAKKLSEEEWKKTLVDASCIFWSHVVFWSSKNPQDLNSYLALLRNHAPKFKCAKEAEMFNDTFSVIEKSTSSKLYKFFNKRKIELAGRIVGLFHDSLESIDPNQMLTRCIDHMQKYRNNLHLQHENIFSKDVFMDIISDYCRETYRFIEMDMPENAVFYFLSFDMMRENLKNPNLNSYYTKYVQILDNYDS